MDAQVRVLRPRELLLELRPAPAVRAHEERLWVDGDLPFLQSVTENVGGSRDYQKEPGKLEFPNLKLTLAETSASSWNAWFDSFVIQGNNGEESERYGSLEFLAADGKEVFAHVYFYNIGIYRLGPTPRMLSGADTIARLEAELYCERMTLKLGPAPLTLGPGDHISTSVPGSP